ncbi:adenylyltransferase/cytidyltransferase family protein [Salinimonas marina]|uniref:Adenylyltransferase/cytidyltransferase family protein n=1 Tax=Salinimonas marina TaxID=2785918 RepID=A0A7S9DYN6_9ALTE|nr:adenylyltransferase/cytidyltransferase family protein [Salinimonas marina]QPG06401.1 adenylyltransferase/cytidyltransferase family protein [Salinimonas marina]
MKRIVTFGTFDLFHVGHANLLQRAAALGDILLVGVSTDELNLNKKGRKPLYSYEDRVKIISSLRYVNLCFAEESLEKKADYLRYYEADVLVMGDDWKGKFDHLKEVCEVVYLERTPSVSTTEIIEVISSK